MKIHLHLFASALLAGSVLSVSSHGYGYAFAQTAAVQAPAPTSSVSIHGHVADPTGAVIPGAHISVTLPNGKTVAQTASDGTGGYQFAGLPAGSYILLVTNEGFAPFSSPQIVIAAGQNKRVEVAMAIEVTQQNVVVTEDAPTVSVDAESNANSVVIKGKDLDALSDDPDELSNELSALAGPAAGPNGGQIYIDGFTGGQLPPKSAIREIRINQNPYSAEYDKLGYGRIEILTKPGTDKLHGQFFVMGGDSALNTSNPFFTNVPGYYRYQFNGSLSGSLSKSASFFVDAMRQSNQNMSVYSATTVTENLDGSFSQVEQTGAVNNPTTFTEVTPRLDLQIGANNTLSVRYQYNRREATGNLSSQSLPTQATSSTSTDNTVQISDTQIFNSHLVSDTRFEYERTIATAGVVSTTPSTTVSGYFSGGGNAAQTSRDHQDHLELKNTTTLTLGAQTIKFGGRLRDTRDANSSDQNFNGTFTFDGLQQYEDTLTALQNGTAITAGDGPSQLTYITGPLGAQANVFDAAAFLQDDWKVNRKLTLSGGLRWESQNHVSDHSDWAPRVSFAYALDGHGGKQPKTVLRGGFGIFYDRMGISDLLAAVRNSGNPLTAQTTTIISNPTCYSATSLSGLDLSTCGTGTSTASTTTRVAHNYRSPYTEQTGLSLERQLTKTMTLTATYLHSFGVHQLVERNANAYLPGTYDETTSTGTRPDASQGNVYEYFPEAVFEQNQLILNANARISPRFSIFGFYSLSYANSDGGAGTNPSNSYNLGQDYGRASFNARHRVFAMANYTGPWGISFNPFLMAQSGNPYNIVLGDDLNGDTFFNDRPSYFTGSSCTTTNSCVSTAYGELNMNPGSSDQPISINRGNGPAAVAFNMRVSRGFGIGPKTQNASSDNGNMPPPGGGPGGGGPPGGGGGGRGGGGGFGGPGGPGGPGGRGGMGGGNGLTGQRKYSLNFSVQALNLFNNIDYGTPVGTIGSGETANDNFGHSKSLVGGMYSSGSAARRIFLQASFNF